jgi:hypothetical protein
MNLPSYDKGHLRREAKKCDKKWPKKKRKKKKITSTQ